jgi:peptidyl-prolyl cis-trans isomerase SurA
MKNLFRSLSLIILYISLTLTQFACKTNQKVPEKSNATPLVTQQVSPPPTPPPAIALSIGNTEIKTEDLKDEVESILSIDSIKPEEALKEIILNHRMVEDAKKRGYKNTEDFEGEYRSYRSIEAEKYLTDSTIIQHLLKETYQWMKEEVNVSHIMFQLPEFAEPADTLAIYNKLIELRHKALSGEDFGQLAQQFSQDKKTNSLGGSIGWFTALKNVYSLEKAAYTTPKDSISMPFRTKMGYHILKVNDRRPYSGKLIVNHIMKFVPPKANEIVNLKVRATIDSIYNRLLIGDDFGLLSSKHSDDEKRNFAGTRKVSIGEYEEAFEEVAFSLKEGETSKPFRSSGGWHILKLVQKEPLESYEELLAKLKNKVTTDSRGEVVKEYSLNKLKKQLIFVENEAIVRLAIAAVDSNLFRKKWMYALNDEAVNKPIFSLWKKDIKGKDFYEFVLDRQTFDKIPNGYTPPMAMKSYYKKFVENTIKTYAEENLEAINKDFKLLMNEYKTSILTTHLLNDLVYEKSISDTTGQRLFYEKNLHKYMMPERIFATLITAKEEKNILKAKEIFEKGTPYQLKLAYAKSLYYGKNLSDLTVEHKTILVGLLEVMRKNKDYIVEIGGHADTGEGDNVSAERIEKVKKFLINNSLPLERISENDYAKTTPADKFDWTKNQRINFQFFSNAKKDVEKVFNKKTPNAVTIQEGYFRRGENKFIDQVKWAKGNFSTQKEGIFAEIIIEKIDNQRPKTLREARGEVIADYQKFLEKLFYEELEKKYPIKFNNEEVEKVLKPFLDKTN